MLRRDIFIPEKDGASALPAEKVLAPQGTKGPEAEKIEEDSAGDEKPAKSDDGESKAKATGDWNFDPEARSTILPPNLTKIF